MNREEGPEWTGKANTSLDAQRVAPEPGMKLVLATRNAHKVAEIRRILAEAGLAGVELVDLSAWPDLPEAPEDHDSFEDNAVQKARFVHQHLGLPCVADDSGIEVAALDWGPGVHSKRFTPQATAASNNRRMLAELDGVDDRRARFRCVLALVCDGGQATASGSVTGHIGTEPRGAGGFGYDPLFWPDEAPGQTMAELSADDKNAISHRGRAFRQLPGLLRQLGLAG